LDWNRNNDTPSPSVIMQHFIAEPWKLNIALPREDEVDIWGNVEQGRCHG
jgi:hypothetical protein